MGRYERAIVTSGLSKAYGLPGLRIGWVVGERSAPYAFGIDASMFGISPRLCIPTTR